MPGVLLVDHFVAPAAPYQPVSGELAEQLRATGWDVTTASTAKSNVGFLADVLKIIAARRSHYDVAHIAVFSGRAFLWAEAAGWLLRRIGKPYVLTLHGGNLPAFSRGHPSRVRRLLGHAAAVTAPSHYLADGLREFRAGIEVIPNGLLLDRYAFQLRRFTSARLVWLRSLRKHYRPELAVDAAAQLVEEFPSLQLQFIGPDHRDGTADLVRERIASHGISGHVTVSPGVPKAEVPRALATHDIFLNTTDIDNTPTTVLEAMACGLCVVTTNAGGIPQITSHGEDALVVPRGDAAAIASAVRRILTEQELAEQLSRRGRERAADLDWKPIGQRWHELLTSAVESATKPAPAAPLGMLP